MCVPLKMKKGEIIGVVQVINKTGVGVFSRGQGFAAVCERETEAFPFTAQDLQFVQVFASQAATAVQNSGGVLSDGGPQPICPAEEIETPGSVCDLMCASVARRPSRENVTKKKNAWTK